jgi:transmembrane sensor
MPARPSEVMQQAAEWVVQLRSSERLAGKPMDQPVPAGDSLAPVGDSLAPVGDSLAGRSVPGRPVAGRPVRRPMGQSNCEELFVDWLRASPLHVREYLRAVEIWEGLSHPNAGSGRSREQLIAEAGDSNLVELPGREDVSGNAPARRVTSSAFRWRRVGFALALSAVFVLAYLGWQRTTMIVVRTGVGEQHSEVLPDRSIVDVNTQSEIRVAFTSSERRVELVRGEAFFDVAKDPTRPFIVATDLATAKAVGTRFSVYRSQSGTIVTVAEGRVLVRDRLAVAGESNGAADPHDAVEVIPGIQAEAQPGHHVQMRRANVASTFAWREHRLVFDAEPLATVVEEFNRYNSPPLVISDPHLREQHISGVFGANDPESLLDFLVKVDHIAVTRDANGVTHIGGDTPD